jgi:alpha-tubulin suppressor-like RCC1 family protein
VTTPLGGTSATTATDQYTYLAKGSVLDWGYGYAGQLGDATGGNADRPVAVHLPAGTVVTATARGGETGYALASSGAVYAWGQGDDGELGNGTLTSSLTPVRVSFPNGTVIKSITAGWQDAYALTSTGAVYAWGDGEFGALGNGGTSDSDVPVAVPLPSGTTITALYAEDYGMLALTSAHTILGWGYDNEGELGNGTTGVDVLSPAAVRLPSGTSVTAIGGAAYNGFAITSAGTVLGWGYGAYGEVGNGAFTSSDVPVKVSLAAGTKVTAVTGGYYTSYALTSTGHVLAWGYGDDGELGNGAQSNSSTPVTVSLPAGTKVAALSAEGYSGLIRTSAGRLLAWGFAGEGDLGNGSLASSDVPVAVSLPAGVSATEAGPSATDGGIAAVSPVPVVTSVSPKSGAKGSKVTITGLNLTGATKVLFGTAAAKFTVVSATKITATVPAGSGKVTVAVTTPLGTASGQFSYTA